MTSRVRQNFAKSCEDGINKQVSLELYASYVYLSMSSHFDRDDVALPGLKNYFLKASHEERGHAEKLLHYLNMRGGRVVLGDIKKPAVDEWGTALNAVESALELEKTVNQSLLDLHKLAGEANDPNMCDFIENHFLHEQVESIKELADFVTNLKRVGPGLGEYMFDKETMKGGE